MDFYKTVYDIVKKIPYGKVMTYGQVATLAGNPNAARQVGWALHVNSSPEIIPCYRVVFNDGRLSRSFVFGGHMAQRELLEKEGVKFDEAGNVKKEFFFIEKVY